MAAYNAAGVGTISGVIYAETKSGSKPTTILFHDF